MEKQKQTQNPLPFLSLPSLQFIAAEITAAEQLIHLSESSGGVTSACSGSSSINAPQVDDVAEDDECIWGRNNRYRSIYDLYASTAQINGSDVSKKMENKKRKAGDKRYT